MSTAYLLARLNTKVFPPFVEDVQICSQSAPMMAGGVWVGLFSVEGESFHEANNLMIEIIKNHGLFTSRLKFVRTFIDAPRVGFDLRKKSAAVEAAIKLVDILQTPADKF